MPNYLTQNMLKILTLLLLLATPLAIASPDLTQIKLPSGFEIKLFASAATKNSAALRGVRFIAFDAKGNLYVSVAKANKVLMLPDANQDGVADEVITVAENLNAPQGLAFVGDDLLVANQNGVVKLKQTNGQWSLPQPFITNLPAGGHTLKNIKLGADGFLYINVGSSCNVCLENDPLRATILRYTVAGQPAGALVTLGRHQQSAVWARGLRNSQGFAWHPVTKQMFATNNGADNRSAIKNGVVNDELPPEHLNKIEAGKHYGWPHCWADSNNLNAQVEDPNFAAETGFCKNTQAPAITFTSHTTPIGITFLDKTNWPAEYKSDAIVAMHGSWNRKQPAGYQLVRVKFKYHQAYTVEDFATGWLHGKEAWGRPVDVAVGTDGALYVTDDKLGAIYRISYQGK
ncbi:MAG: PQQ-dependent sugar dehydrogenase [Methylotenera sp.]|nr:PQQ-dependent sugar dehydrogenase [Methylotenera sp.]